MVLVRGVMLHGYQVHIVKIKIPSSYEPISYTVGFRRSKTALFDCFFFDLILLTLLLVSRVDFIAFVLFLEAVGVRECCCMALENRLAALCFARSSRATRASRATNFRPSGLVALGLAESRQSYVRFGTQPRAAKATAGVAVVGKMASITRATAIV